MFKLREFEEEMKSVSTTVTNRTLSSNMSGSQGGIFNSTMLSQKCDVVVFKPITEKQMVTTAMQANGYPKSYHLENSCELLFKIKCGDNKLLRSVFENNGFSQTESHDWNILWTACPKSYLYEGLNEHQKINHFPQSMEITRKDRMCFNIVRMQERFGKQHFDFVPDTYILPDEFGEFYEHY